tara:strand:+ start:2354 stop:5176 length:2823 start_codon:yes stop_codon:yes gene_type:complete
MDYSLNIVTSVKGQASIDSALKSIAKVRNLAADIKPISLTTGKSGKLHDEIRIAKTELDKFSQKITNTLQRGESTAADFSSTLSGVVGQARAFATALDNISLKSGKAFEEQSAEVQNYARTLAEAEKKATELAFTQNQIIRSARQQSGVAIGPATQLGSPEALAQQVRFESAQIEKGNRLREEQAKIVQRINDLAANKVKISQFDSQIAKINLALDERQVDAAEQMTEELKDQIRQNERIINQNKKKKKGAEEEGAASRKITGRQRAGNILQGALLGGGFPLLFGGPSFSALGGLVGGGIGGGIGPTGRPGFAGGIAGSVVGQVFDSFVKAALNLGKALENPTKNIQQLVDLLPLAGTRTKGLIGELQDLGLDSVAGAVAVQELNDQIGALGAQDVKKIKESTDNLTNAFKELQLAGAAFGAPGITNTITLLTKLITAFKTDQGFVARAGRAGLSFLTRSDATEDFLGKKGPFTETPQATLKRLQEENEKTKPKISLRELQIQTIIGNIRQQTRDIANQQTNIEKNRLGLIRGQFAVEQADLSVNRAQLAFDKARLNVLAEEVPAEKRRLELKRDIAKAALDEAKASKQNAEILARQQQASAELGIRQFLQGIQLNEMQQRIAVDRQTRAASAGPAAMLDPFFGKSEQLKNEQAVRYTETLRVLNEQIEENNMNIRMGKDLSDAERAALVKKDILLQRELNLLKELQPARDEAALAQVRFAEAMALTVPVTDGLFDSLYAVVEGTKTAEQAFADFLRSIASILQDAAKQIISTYIAIGIARAFAGMGSSSTPDPFSSNVASVLPDTGNLADVAASTSLKLASGGYISGPTNALIGEGGQPEYVIPASKMTEAMGRYARGARGSAVIPEGDGASTEGGMGGGSGVVDVRYSVERINNVDYVTAAEFERGMNQAAKRGAELGRQGVYSDLVNKRSVRSRVGV